MSHTSFICIGVGAQSTLGVTTFLPEKYVWKINKMPEFYMIFARKYPNFTSPEKYFSPVFYWGGGAGAYDYVPTFLRLCSFTPVSYTSQHTHDVRCKDEDANNPCKVGLQKTCIQVHVCSNTLLACTRCMCFRQFFVDGITINYCKGAYSC